LIGINFAQEPENRPTAKLPDDIRSAQMLLFWCSRARCLHLALGKFSDRPELFVVSPVSRSSTAQRIYEMNDATTATARRLATDETDRLISSNKVEGTPVYNPMGERLGKVHHLMIDKYTGQVAYAVMSFGGFLGMGEKYYPLPWTMLTYDTRMGSYVVDLDRSKLENAPSFTSADAPNWSERSYTARIDDYWRNDRTGGLAADETERLISSDKVEGTPVYNPKGERLGKVHHLMIDKYTGQVAYAVMSFGGFLGIGEKYNPLPWKMLAYDTRLGGYVVDIDRSKLENAPSFASGDAPDWSDRSYTARIEEYWLVIY
jgi:sporulation protein YlmC with PRC-barrel domain